MIKELPSDAKDLDLDMLNAIIQQHMPNLVLRDFSVTEMHQWGSGLASSAGRIVIEPVYAKSNPSPHLRHIVLKVARIDPENTPARRRSRGALYANEVNIYTRLNPASLVESPMCVGGIFDPESYTFILMLEDL
ncbi:MAG TPA: hypothetical protein VFM32_07125, partial [Spongiibacteraceae bacterium]|nr:hypothetical protein [Spongiibacteraceae bacterium]